MKTLLLIALLCAVNLSFAQPKLQSYGEPFVKSNVVDLKAMQSRFTNTGSCDTIAVLIDIGEEGGSNTQNFQAVFIALNGQCTNATVKDFAGNDVTVNLGKPSSNNLATFTAAARGIDGNLYVGTEGDGGHLIRIDMRNKTAVDLGKPYTSSVSGKVTALGIGADFSVCGIVQEGGSAYAFRYKYGCSFDVLAYTGSSPYNLNAYISANYPDFTNIVDVATDSVYTYVEANNVNNNNHVLFAINNATNEVKAVDLLSGTGGGYVHVGYFYIDTYGEDKVYIRNASGSHEIIPSSGGGLVLSLAAAPAGKRVSSRIWTSKALNAVSDYTTEYNNDDFKFYYKNAGVDSGFKNLSNCVRKVGKPIATIAPYIDSTTGQKSIFIHGAAAQQAFTYNIIAHQLTKLGANVMGAAAAITNSQNYKEVYIGGGSVIQKYSSALPWQYNTDINPKQAYSTYKLPNPLGANCIMKNINGTKLIAAAGVNVGLRPGAIADETSFAIVNTRVDTVTTVYDPLFSEYYYDHKVMDVDQRNKAIVLACGKTSVPYNYKLMAFDTASNRLFHYNVLRPDGTGIGGAYNVAIDTSNNAYITSGGSLLVVTDYFQKGLDDSTEVRAELVYAASGAIGAIGLFPDKKYMVLACSSAGSSVNPSESGVEMHVVDLTDRNKSFPYNMGNTTIVENMIVGDVGRAMDFVFADSLCFVNGFGNLWGFNYSSITAPVIDFDDYLKKGNSDIKQNGIGPIKANEDAAIKFFPNPATSKINVALTSDKATSLKIEIFDAKGTLVSNKDGKIAKGRNIVELNIQNLSSGIYLLRISNASGTQTKRFFKQ